MKKLGSLVLVLFAINNVVFPQSIANLVKIDSLKKYVRELSGDLPVTINGVTSYIKSRNTFNPHTNISDAAEYIKSKFKSFGFSPIEQSFTAEGYSAKNIIAIQEGSKYPDREFIICAHYDSMPEVGLAPGADDNASGTSCVIEAARIFSQSSPEYTVKFVAFSGEEQGLYGSYYYVNQALEKKETILGVINLDMIAWNSTGKNIVEIYYKNIGNGNQVHEDELLNKVTLVNSYYSLNLTLSKVYDIFGGSDHQPFLENSFPAIFITQDWNNPNINYHSSSDTYESLYYDFFENCSKLAIFTLAELSQPDGLSNTEYEDSCPESIELYQNYPNPFNPTTTIKFGLPENSHIKLEIFNILGEKVEELINSELEAGYHEVNFDATWLSSGMYIYRIKAGEFVQAKKLILIK